MTFLSIRWIEWHRKASDNTKAGHADTIDDEHEEEEKIEAIDDIKSGIDLGQVKKYWCYFYRYIEKNYDI